VYFEDTGVGISSDVIGRIWEPLFTTKAQGMGFGLSITKRIVEAHKGKIDVKSVVGQGSVFKLSLPVGNPV
jgi:signal transduction histidine kinase